MPDKVATRQISEAGILTQGAVTYQMRVTRVCTKNFLLPAKMANKRIE